MEEQDYILIEQYLQGELPAAEAAALEARMATEPAFAAAVGERKLLNGHLKAVAQEPALRSTLQQLGEQHFTEQVATVRKLGTNRRWLYGVAAAAVIALAVLLGGPWLFSTGNSYEQFAQHDPLRLTERGSSPDLAAQIERAFNDARYAEAIPLLREYLRQQTEDERARLALGIALLEDEKDEEAVKIFTEIAAGKSTLVPYANWYLALAAVKRGDNEAALEFLDLIPASDTYLTGKANELRATL